MDFSFTSQNWRRMSPSVSTETWCAATAFEALRPVLPAKTHPKVVSIAVGSRDFPSALTNYIHKDLYTNLKIDPSWCTKCWVCKSQIGQVFPLAVERNLANSRSHVTWDTMMAVTLDFSAGEWREEILKLISDWVQLPRERQVIPQMVAFCEWRWRQRAWAISLKWKRLMMLSPTAHAHW